MKLSEKKILETLTLALRDNHCDVTSEMLTTLFEFLVLLHRWNDVYNLTAIKNIIDIIYLHIIDSLTIKPFLKGQTVIDIGSGAGFPGIPLAILCPHLQFTLLDSNGKKTRFLTQAKAELGIQNIKIIQARTEDYEPPVQFDNIVSRAFSSIAVMLKNTQQLLAKNGQFLAMKGIYPQAEINDVISPFKVTEVHSLKIHGREVTRHLVCVEKN